jgi:hypothetical protein
MTREDTKEVSERVRMPAASLGPFFRQLHRWCSEYAAMFENLGMEPAIVSSIMRTWECEFSGIGSIPLHRTPLTGRTTCRCSVGSPPRSMAKFSAAIHSCETSDRPRQDGIYPMPVGRTIVPSIQYSTPLSGYNTRS